MLFRCTILLIVIAGCEPLTISLPVAEPTLTPPTLGERFDATQCGMITGTVTWAGVVPEAKTFIRNVGPTARTTVGNPNAVTTRDGKLANAVIQLSNIDPVRSKLWNHELVTVELNDLGIIVLQGTRRGRVGFVKLGDEVTFQLASDKVLGVRARGDAFFGRILTPMQSTVTHRFTRPGRVELRSASGQYWAAAKLIVSELPYCTITDDRGRFEFRDVPAGAYEVTVSHPSPVVTATEIDPESSLTVRQTYAPAFRGELKAVVTPGGTATVTVDLSTATLAVPATKAMKP